ncbi:hypothetical protein MUU72_09525 [Streptomyces sp. RS10V-4]|uniref:hypothetical protein n=1 Tax=Streptomyces rhizoryzae TaxID=2932493 RepID=UPI00200468C6|nr:hypothetical protein [Streptomyces rhizoryzae]MCK7623331.1 hypothetical protein [Streptomyces rhizoryzae]
MMRTTTSVAGQPVCTLIVVAPEGILDRDADNGVKSISLDEEKVSVATTAV